MFGSDSDSKQRLKMAMKEATTFAEWKAAAMELDVLNDADTWKHTFESADYDYELVATRIQLIKKAIDNADYESMKFLLRTSKCRMHHHRSR